MKDLIAQGWERYRAGVLPPNASKVQVDETRNGFYAGAYHLFTGIIKNLSPGIEPTEADYDMLRDIDVEFKTFIQSKRG
jgi:hypothetical protein